MTPPGQKPIDPSGNWAMTAKDSNNNVLHLAALFNQVGSTVTANSITPTGNGSTYTCTSWNPSFTNGQVQNVSTFSGTITAEFGPLSFTGTLNQAGTHVDGTYSGLSTGNCGGVAASGTFAGDEVPSTSGNWTGTLTPCSYDQQTGICTNNGVAGNVTFTLTQDDATGNVTGTYSVTGLSQFSNGTVAVVPPSDILSGLVWQFTMTDANKNKFVANGTLALDRSFSGNTFLEPAGAGTPTFKLAMTH